MQNHITQNDQLAAQLQKIVKEYTQKEIGCELAIKEHIYHIIVLLLRQYKQESLNNNGYERQQKGMNQLRTVLEYIDHHYNETISLTQLANLAKMSYQHQKISPSKQLNHFHCF